MSNCEYYSIWEEETGKLTEWGTKLHDYAVNFRNLDITDPKLRDVSFERIENSISEYSGAQRRKLKLAEYIRKQMGFPVECPHKHIDEANICVYHLSTSKYENYPEVSQGSIIEDMGNKINDENSNSNDSVNCFAGAKIKQLDLQSPKLSPENHEALNYSFAEIDELRITDCDIRNELMLDGTSIDSFVCKGSKIYSELTCEYAEIAGETLEIKSSTFNESVSFKSSKIKVMNVDIDQNIFHGKFNFDKSQIQLEYLPHSDRNTEINISKTVFDGIFDFSGCVISTGEDVNAGTSIKIDDCEFRNDAIWARTKFKPSEEVLFEEEEDDTRSIDEGWGKNKSTDQNEYNYDINLNITSSIFHSGGNFEHVEIYGDLNIEESEFVNGAIEFNCANINGYADFEDTSFGTGDFLFEKFKTGGYLNFSEVAFGSGELKINNSKIGSYLDLVQSSFSGGKLSFSGTLVTGCLLMNGADFRVNAGEIDMSNLTVESNVDLKQTTFSATEIDLSGMVIKADGEWPNNHQSDQLDCEITLKGSDWNGGVIKIGAPPSNNPNSDYNRTKFKGNVAFDLVNFSGQQLNFEYVLVDNDITFEYSEFNTSITSFSLSEFDGCDVDFSNTLFNSSAILFQGAKFVSKTVDFESAKFEGKLEFSPKELRGSFPTTEIERENWLNNDDRIPSLINVNEFNFSFATTSREMRFDEVKFKRCNSIKFNNMSCPNTELRFEEIRSTSSPIEFRQTSVNKGIFLISGTEPPIYDFVGSKIGDISIENRGNGKLLEHFIFKDTEFSGFDFSKNKVKKHLKESGWNIHTSLLDDMKSDSRGILSKLTTFLNRSYRIVRYGINNEATHPDKLETTYMKARIGAEEQGDSDTVSKFFEKELHFRRHTYAYQFWELTDIIPLHGGKQTEKDSRQDSYQEDDSKSINESSDNDSQLINESNVPDFAKDSRLLLAWKWFTNMALYLSVGYGERASNVILTSAAVIAVFSFVHRGISALPPGSTQFDYLTYSLQGFISLIIGVQTSGSLIVRFFTSVEGFIGGFIIALFVITMTRSIDR